MGLRQLKKFLFYHILKGEKLGFKHLAPFHQTTNGSKYCWTLSANKVVQEFLRSSAV